MLIKQNFWWGGGEINVYDEHDWEKQTTDR